MERATAAVEGAGDGLADGIEREDLRGKAAHLAQTASPIAQRGVRSERLRARLEQVDDKVSSAIDATRTKARAVAESARRARHAPGQALERVQHAAKAYAGGLAASIGFYAAAGLVGAITLVLLTVGFVQGLTELWGRPWGALAVALAYGIVALALATAAKGRAARGRSEARRDLEVAKAEVRQVAEPIRDAFRRKPEPATKVKLLVRPDDATALQARPVDASVGAQPLRAAPPSLSDPDDTRTGREMP